MPSGGRLSYLSSRADDNGDPPFCSLSLAVSLGLDTVIEPLLLSIDDSFAVRPQPPGPEIYRVRGAGILELLADKAAGTG